MRRNSLSQGTGAFALARPRLGRSANSSALSGGLVGTSRKVKVHTTSQMKLAMASTTKEPRQDTNWINSAIKGGVTALPIRAKEWVMPCAKAQLRSGVHVDMARVAVGNVAPSPMPSEIGRASCRER